MSRSNKPSKSNGVCNPAAPKALNNAAQGNALGLGINQKSSPEWAIQGMARHCRSQFMYGISNPQDRHPISVQYGLTSVALSGLGLTTAPKTQGVALG